MATAFGYFLVGRYDEAVHAVERSLAENPAFAAALRMRIVCYALLGNLNAARQEALRLRAVAPRLTIASMREYFRPLIRHNPEGFENYFKGFRLAGFPEE